MRIVNFLGLFFETLGVFLAILQSKFSCFFELYGGVTTTLPHRVQCSKKIVDIDGKDIIA